MADYRKQANRLAADSPSLATVPPMGQTSFVIRYYKGAAMLDTFAPNHGRREVLSDEPRVLSELAKMRIVDVRAGIPAACEGGTSYKRPQNDGLPGGSAA